MAETLSAASKADGLVVQSCNIDGVQADGSIFKFSRLHACPGVLLAFDSFCTELRLAIWTAKQTLSTDTENDDTSSDQYKLGQREISAQDPRQRTMGA